MAAFLLALEIACLISLVPCQPCAGAAAGREGTCGGCGAHTMQAEMFLRGFPGIVLPAGTALRRMGRTENCHDVA